jgi:hypothetical protein
MAGEVLAASRAGSTAITLANTNAIAAMINRFVVGTTIRGTA